MASMAPVTVLHMPVKGCHPGIGMWACKQDQLPTCSLLKVIVSGTCSAKFRSCNLNLLGKLYWNLLLNTGMGMTPSSKPAMHATHGGPSTIDFVLGATNVEKNISCSTCMQRGCLGAKIACMNATNKRLDSWPAN